MATESAPDASFNDFGRSFSERRREAQKHSERCSFEGPPAKEMDDGYAPREGAYQSNNKGDGLHASGDSSGALNELADPFHQREPSVRRPPSIDGARKPRRSESELPDSAVVAAARKEAAEKAAAASGAPAPITGMKDVDGYKGTTYYADAAKNESGFTMLGSAPCNIYSASGKPQ